MKPNSCRVIDCNSWRILEVFDKSQTQAVFEKYVKMDMWDEITLDNDGDILLSIDDYKPF